MFLWAALSAAGTTEEAAAERARDRVKQLAADYTEAENAVAQGISRLAEAYELADAASLTADDMAAQRDAAAAKRSRDVRAVYASGGPAGLTATLLAAQTPIDLLWRKSTNTQLMKGILGVDHLALRSAQAESRLAARNAADAERAADQQAETMSELQAQAGKAETALEEARRTLRRLDRKAQQAKAADEARRELARVQRVADAKRRNATSKVVTALGIPADFEKAYRAAGSRCVGLRWTLLAAVGQVESGHGRNVGPSSAGAKGPMQFMAPTFAAYGVDGDGDGVIDVWDPEDAIFSAARYLCASGLDDAKQDSAARDRDALFAYNRADWYVDLVLSAEQAILSKMG
ncbi:hypothetical protein GCM10027456_53260 [Kineosporia babensis]